MPTYVTPTMPWMAAAAGAFGNIGNNLTEMLIKLPALRAQQQQNMAELQLQREQMLNTVAHNQTMANLQKERNVQDLLQSALQAGAEQYRFNQQQPVREAELGAFKSRQALYDAELGRMKENADIGQRIFGLMMQDKVSSDPAAFPFGAKNEATAEDQIRAFSAMQAANQGQPATLDRISEPSRTPDLNAKLDAAARVLSQANATWRTEEAQKGAYSADKLTFAEWLAQQPQSYQAAVAAAERYQQAAGFGFDNVALPVTPAPEQKPMPSKLTIREIPRK